MKKIIIVRHSRAEDQTQEFTDFERSLNGKGKSVARKMARELKERESNPGIMISSPAFRALETAIIFASEFDIKPEKIIMDSSLYYNMSLYRLEEILSELSESKSTLTIFGHNPSFSDIAGSLSKEGCDVLPKCAVVTISFNVKSWQEVIRRTGKLEYFLKPEKSI